jgi:predicted DCC family thiol-disulfide oxidoreductase YuxK
VDEGDLPPRDTLLRELHLQKADGDMLVGIDANVAAWQHTRYGMLLRWMAWPGIRALTSRVYAFWARRRYQRLYGRL